VGEEPQEIAIPPAPPAVTSVTPNVGPDAGGTSVSISGSEFTSASTVDFGSSAATAVKVNSPESITATAPAGAEGNVDVTVTNAAGTRSIVEGDRLSYLETKKLEAAEAEGEKKEGKPVVEEITPDAVPLTGQTVTITGANFTSDAATAKRADA